ncbi:unnamed protein product [Mytilus coruscus]|uniref:DZIP3-like HEPN domain-containing protein n=1 Tax=Mytilus coruscus TaxID=42192 RepID=A0A6J8C694_MYTCO|nr:unnamed protein product [Mytilus coruscus]
MIIIDMLLEKGDKSLMLKAELEIGGDLMTLKAESGNEPLSRIHAARIEYAVKDVIPNIVKDLLTLYIPPQTLCRRVNSVHSFEPRLRAEEWTKIRNAASTGYRDFDVPLVLKLLNRLCGHNMGPKLREDMSIYGRYYDSIAHKMHSSIMFKEKFDTSFNDFKNIARGFEHIMHKRSNELVLQLEQLRGGVMDYHLEDVTDYLT